MQPVRSFRIILIIALLLGARVVWGADIWREDFVGFFLLQPPGWSDETEDPASDAEIFCSYTPFYAAITRTAEGTQGSVLSPEITCNVASYGNIKISIISVSPSATWKISIVKGASTWPLNDFTMDTGVLVYDYAEKTGMKGSNTFYIQLTLQGAAGENMEVDYISINDEAAPTPTFTHTEEAVATPTFTHTEEAVATPTFTHTEEAVATPTFTHTEEAVATPTFTHTEEAVPTTYTPTEEAVTPTDTPVTSIGKNLDNVQFNTKTFTPAGPINQELVITFQSDVPRDFVKVSIFSVNGRLQIELVPEGSAPNYTVRWNGEDAGGRKLTGGIYIYQISAGDSNQRGAVVIAR